MAIAPCDPVETEEVIIRKATDIGHFDAAARLIRAYQREWGHELGCQDLDDEAHRLQEIYAPPDGGLLIATVEDVAIGVIAWERLDGRRTECRMKRLYVDPAARGTGAGRALVDGLVDTTRAAGFTRMVLDTTAGMDAARGLYRSTGFAVVQPDWESPCRAPVFMARAL